MEKQNSNQTEETFEESTPSAFSEETTNTPEASTTSSETDNNDTPSDELTTLKEEVAKLKESYIRLMAEYDNHRKRTLKEKAELIKSGGERIIAGFVEILDDLDLAMENVEKASDLEGMKEGLELIFSKFTKVMTAQGVTEIPTIGEEFNPETYEAVAIVPTEENDKKGKIIDCIKKGYALNGKVIRHPKVVVGQ